MGYSMPNPVYIYELFVTMICNHFLYELTNRVDPLQVVIVEIYGFV